MRPESIRRFDMFYLGSVALMVLGFVISFDAAVASIQAQTAAKGVQVGAGFTIGIFAAVLLIDLLLWFLISRKRMALAKWLLVLLVIVDLYGVPALFSGALTPPKMISLLRIVLDAVAVAFLFAADAKAWLTRGPTEEPGDPDSAP
jgi:hypothetical protein